MWKELVIGSNRLIDASGVIVVMDKEQVSLGQTGVAPNGIELHPVLGLSGTCNRA